MATLQVIPRRGQTCPVNVSPEIDWQRDYSRVSLGHLLGMTDDDLASVDPLAMNLIVAMGIPALAHLGIAGYQHIVNEWVSDLKRRCLPQWEPHFHQAPDDFKNDLRYFRLGMVCQYLELEVGIQYKRDQREVKSILYTNPSDLFLNGVLDTREGTCGNLSALQVAMGWRMRWPVSLACVNSHFILRYDDGQTIHNMEATQSGYGGFKSDPDEYLIDEHKLPAIAVASGSDLRALRPREMLGAFIGLRARHLQDVGFDQGREDLIIASETDWLLARSLFPTNRVMYKNQLAITTMRGDALFQADEIGHPNSHVACLLEVDRRRVAKFRTAARRSAETREKPAPRNVDELFSVIEVRS